MIASPGATIKLSWQQTQGDTSLYPQAVIKDSAGTTIATVSLTHDSNGLYAGTTTLLVAEGTYSCQFLPYTNAGHTTLSGVDEIVHETISIQYGWRPSFGGGGGTATIPKNIIDPLLKILKEIAEKQEKLEIELAKKSEFNPKKDIVKTDIKPTSLRYLIDKLDKIQPQKQKDYTTLIERIKNQIVKEIQNIPKIDLEVLSSGIEKLKSGQIKDSSFRQELIQSVNNLDNKLKSIGGNISLIPKSDFSSSIGEIKLLIGSFDTAKPSDISRLSQLLVQLQSRFSENSKSTEQLLETFNQIVGKNDLKILVELKNIWLELRRISGFKEDNKSIFNKLSALNEKN